MPGDWSIGPEGMVRSMHAHGTALALMFACGTVAAGMNGPCAAHAADGPERSQASAEPAQGREASDIAGALNPLWIIPLSELSATRNRPVFSPSRLPAAPPLVPVAAPAPPKPVAVPREADRPPLALVGTIVSESLQIAIFLEETTKATTRLKAGESYHGWMLRSVAIGEANLERAERTTTLALQPVNPVTMSDNLAPASDTIAPVRHRKR